MFSNTKEEVLLQKIKFLNYNLEAFKTSFGEICEIYKWIDKNRPEILI